MKIKKQYLIIAIIFLLYLLGPLFVCQFAISSVKDDVKNRSGFLFISLLWPALSFSGAAIFLSHIFNKKNNSTENEKFSIAEKSLILFDHNLVLVYAGDGIEKRFGSILGIKAVDFSVKIGKDVQNLIEQMEMYNLDEISEESFNLRRVLNNGKKRYCLSFCADKL